MNVYLIPSTFDCGNVGDVAMLQTAVSRLKSLWPEAKIRVPTSDVDTLRRLCPSADPFLRTRRGGAGRVARFGARFSRAARRAIPALGASALVGSERSTALVVASGASSLNDVFASYSRNVLSTLEDAQRRRIPTALLSQGLGPVTNPALLAQARAVLPRVDLIALRESRSGPAILDSIGVDPSRVRMTGDDAVAPAYEARPVQPGNGLGLNVRVSWNADVDQSDVASLRPIVQSFASEHGVPLLPVPISLREGVDERAIQALVEGAHDPSQNAEALDTPSAVIRQVGRCSMVVTGAYHAAVFALAQGVPALCLYRSAYYRDKFLGLRDLFGDGCSTLALEAGWQERLPERLRLLWSMAATCRRALLAAAVRQVEAGRSVYGELPRILGEHHA